MPGGGKGEDGIYSVHPAVAHAKAILDNLPASTGRTLREWMRLVRSRGPKETRDRRDWLRTEHRLGAVTASMIVERTEGRGREDSDPEAYLAAAARHVETMYSGPRAGLRPIHEALVRRARALGPDVRVSPCRTIVPLYREHVFAQLKPSARTRLDLGLALEGAKRRPPGRLIDTGGLRKGDRITHRIPLSSVDEIDDQVVGWLRTAYELDA